MCVLNLMSFSTVEFDNDVQAAELGLFRKEKVASIISSHAVGWWCLGGQPGGSTGPGVHGRGGGCVSNQTTGAVPAGGR